MGRSKRLRFCDLRDIYRLIGECRDLGDDARGWRTHLFRETCRLVGAQVACGGEMGLAGSGPVVLQCLDMGWAGDKERDRFLEFLQRPESCTNQAAGGGVGPVLNPVADFLARGMRPMTRTRQQLLPDRAWYGSSVFNEYIRHSGLDHNLSGITGEENVTPATFQLIALHRPLGDKPFRPRDRRLLHCLHHELSPLVGRQLASSREPSAAGLPPRLRQTLDGLLAGDSAKQVAARLDLSPRTVEGYVKAVYRHFGASSRGELLARFVRRRG